MTRPYKRGGIDWHPIKERPQLDVDVLVCDRDGNVFTAFLAEAYPFEGKAGSWAVHRSYNGECECPIDGKRLRFWAEFPDGPIKRKVAP